MPNSNPKLWLTYSWKDRDEGDFAHVVSVLRQNNVDVRYDKIELIPGHRLWEQIGERIRQGEFQGWAYLLTPYGLASEKCREELEYALGRALETRGTVFPLIGLLHQVAVEEVPVSLRSRLCVEMRDPNWALSVKAGLLGEAPTENVDPVGPYRFNVIRSYSGDPELIAVEARPRFGEISFWRFMVPDDCEIVQWGYGPTGGRGLASVMTSVIEATGEVSGEAAKIVGAADRLTASTSAVIVFRKRLPSFVFFGVANEPFELPIPPWLRIYVMPTS